MCERVDDFNKYNSALKEYCEKTEIADGLCMKNGRFDPEVVKTREEARKAEEMADNLLKKMSNPKKSYRECCPECSCFTR